MIDRIEVRGFKTLQNVTIPLAEDITVLVGANNSGKSNVLSALGLLAESARLGSLRTAASLVGGAESLCTRGGERTFDIAVHWKGEASYKLGWPETELLAYPNSNGDKEKAGGDGDPFVFWVPEDSIRALDVVPGGGLKAWAESEYSPNEVSTLYASISNIVLRDLSVSALREPSIIRADVELARDGRNLAAVLDGMPAKMLRAVEETVRTAVPEVKSVLARVANEPGKKAIAIEETDGRLFSVHELSDGLLLFIGLAVSAALAGESHSVLCIEEPERGIHPRRLRDLVDVLRLVAQRGTQVVLTTHSPELLNEFRDQPESVLIVDRDEAGTHITRLSDKKDWIAELKDSSLGNIWYSGVLGGVPKK